MYIKMIYHYIQVDIYNDLKKYTFNEKCGPILTIHSSLIRYYVVPDKWMELLPTSIFP